VSQTTDSRSANPTGAERVEHRRLGTTGPSVPVVSLGTWGMGGASYGATHDEVSIDTIRAALDQGMTLLDTSPVYGRAEEVVARALDGRRDRALIVTKCGLVHDPEQGRFHPDSRRDTVLRGIEGSLNRLGTDYVDVALIHWPDPTRPITEAMEGLNAALEAKLTRYVGVSNFSSSQLREASRFAPIVCNQVSFSIIDRRWQREMFATARALGIDVMAYWTLAGGLLTGSFRRDTVIPVGDWRASGDSATAKGWFRNPWFDRHLEIAEGLSAVARRLGITLPQLAVAWVLSNVTVATAVVGARSPDRIRENLSASRTILSQSDLDEIDRLAQGASTFVGSVPTWETA